MYIFDTHCHYNLEPLYEDWQAHWKTAQTHGIVGSIVVGTDAETSKRALEIASLSHGQLFSSIGIHPCYWQGHDSNSPTVASDELISQEIAKLTDLLEANPNNNTLDHVKALDNQKSLVAFGEIGLDYFRIRTDQKFQQIRANQILAFTKQLDLVSNTSYALNTKPIILHVRDTQDSTTSTNSSYSAYADILEITKKYPNLTYILHCVSGSANYVQEMVSRGAYVSFAGNVTYPSAQPLRDLASLVPKNRVLIETDAPFLTPQKYRGKKCEPYMIEETARYVCTTFGISSEKILENTSACFNIPTIPGTINK